MRRRSRASKAKTRTRKAETPKRRDASRLRQGSASKEPEFLRHELDDAREQQAATADVLNVIAASPGDLTPVFDTILRWATKLCEATHGHVWRFDGQQMHAVAVRGDAAFVRWLRQHDPIEPIAGSAADRIVRGEQLVLSTDRRDEAAYRENQTFRQFVDTSGTRASLAVALHGGEKLLGMINVYRQEARPFSDKQIELVKNFAAQAVIAIENARLFNELRESLQQQTATSEVLRAISSSPGELKPVFQTMLANAVRVCGAKFGILYLSEGNGFRTVAMQDVPRAYAELREREPFIVPLPEGGLGRLARTKQVIHIADYLALPPEARGRLGDLARARTVVSVPMFKDNDLVGAIVIYRQEVRPFTEKQIELLQNFAAQAVIAIENTRLLNELLQRTNDLSEALEQQTASAEVLKVISSSPGDLKPVFDAILANALRICEARFGNLWLREGKQFRIVADLGGSQEYHTQLFSEPLITPGRQSAMGQITETGDVVQIDDMSKEPTYGMNMRIATVEIGKGRTLVGVPMLKNDEVVGIITIYRQEVRPFTDKQIALVKNFAAQAVLAIDNARLLNELRESLEQQTATSDVLRVISSSPGELKPVFDTILENATRICGAKFGVLCSYDGDLFKYVAVWNAPSAFLEFMRQRGSFAPRAGTPLDRILKSKNIIHRADASVDEVLTDTARLAGAKSHLTVPMFKDEALVGAIIIYRQEVRPFSEKQIALVQNFAAQAVIAIENARLLNELRQRTTDLTESLEQQTGTGEILRVISSSPTNVQPVLDTIVRTAVSLCNSYDAVILLREGEYLRIAAHYGPMTLDFQRAPVGRDWVAGRTVLDRMPVHVHDLWAEGDEFPLGRKFALRLNQRTVLGLPLMREGHAIGCLFLRRTEVLPFSEKQVALLQTFADQAAIAIENVRLFEADQQRSRELAESLEQQTATSEVLKVISRSTFDLKSVLNTLVESIARLCEADMAAIRRPKGAAFLHVASHGSPTEYDEYMQSHPIEPDRGSVAGRVLLEGKPVHVPDVQADPEYTMLDISRRTGYHTMLGLPLLREGSPIGVVILGRVTVRPFMDKQIELATTFADQAVIAIENVRLFEEIREKSQQLEEASQHKSQFLANMSHELRTPLNAILGYTELMADGAYGEPSEKMMGVLKRLEANGRHLLGLINDVLDLSKIEAGQLVLELSDYSVQDIAQTVRSTLEPLAADKKLGFTVEVAPQLPPGRGDARRLTQVLINLVGNAIKFTDAGEVAIKAEADNGSFYVSVRDTGPGISAADQAKLFQEFQQADNAITRKKGGTGLGLAISKRIIEMHGGRIWVESQVGQGSTFMFTLPVIVERQVNVESK